MIRYMPLLVLLLLTAWLAVALTQEQTTPHSRMVGRTLPDIALPLLGETKPESLHAVLDNRVAIVHLFASWCVACHKEHQLLKDIAADYDVQLIGIAWRNVPAETAAWLAREGNPFDVIFSDEKGASTVPLGLGGVPETFVMDMNKSIIYHSKAQLSMDDLLPHIRSHKRGEQ